MQLQELQQQQQQQQSASIAMALTSSITMSGPQSLRALVAGDRPKLCRGAWALGPMEDCVRPKNPVGAYACFPHGRWAAFYNAIFDAICISALRPSSRSILHLGSLLLWFLLSLLFAWQRCMRLLDKCLFDSTRLNSSQLDSTRLDSTPTSPPSILVLVLGLNLVLALRPAEAIAGLLRRVLSLLSVLPLVQALALDSDPRADHCTVPDRLFSTALATPALSSTAHPSTASTAAIGRAR
ncbi:hypothetical protein BD289DRAFT_484258 [Coniella lustricola]|uniref:Uncharacterized protein n=1 Tax=Coniella lustricola TaxID=2025994 RepID=A0A2T3A2M7_9PEZI|nr:hypothetical protein BD289DRAFT_484258 [Coniella lustricola]